MTTLANVTIKKDDSIIGPSRSRKLKLGARKDPRRAPTVVNDMSSPSRFVSGMFISSTLTSCTTCHDTHQRAGFACGGRGMLNMAIVIQSCNVPIKLERGPTWRRENCIRHPPAACCCDRKTIPFQPVPAIWDASQGLGWSWPAPWLCCLIAFQPSLSSEIP